MGKTNGLRALELAQLILDEVLDAIEEFPRGDPAGLRYQLATAADSVLGNIAEGFGRATPNEKRNKLRIARGELEEAQAHLRAPARRHYMPAKRFYRIWNLMVVLHRMIVKLMRRR
ncbi:MAG TPA: four helix bundle protein [Gemmatimonadaceae bacterium]|nr:four helix bundle protein [Gemmatimonadaceae bacterium]